MTNYITTSFPRTPTRHRLLAAVLDGTVDYRQGFWTTTDAFLTPADIQVLDTMHNTLGVVSRTSGGAHYPTDTARALLAHWNAHHASA